MALNPLEHELIATIIKKCPELIIQDTFDEWLTTIQSKLDVNVRLNAPLTCQLLFIWLSRKKDITLVNMEALN